MDARAHVSIGFVHPIVAHLSDQIGDPGPALRASGIDPSLLEDPQSRIEVASLASLLAYGVEATGDVGLPARAGLSLRPGQYGIFELVVRTSRDGHDAISRVNRHYDLIGDLPAPHLELRDGEALVLLHMNSRSDSAFVIDYVLASWMAVARFMRGSGTRPNEVWLDRSEPAAASAIRAGFDCDVRFGQAENAILFSPQGFGRAFAPMDPVIAGAIDRRADELAHTIRSDGRFRRDVEREILECLAEEGATLAHVSKRLRVSARTLRRRLYAEDTSFTALRRALQEREARRYLTETNLPIAAVSAEVGFSEPSAFYRAFKRWTGKTPQEVRQGARPNGPNDQ